MNRLVFEVTFAFCSWSSCRKTCFLRSWWSQKCTVLVLINFILFFGLENICRANSFRWNESGIIQFHFLFKKFLFFPSFFRVRFLCWIKSRAKFTPLFEREPISARHTYLSSQRERITWTASILFWGRSRERTKSITSDVFIGLL